MINLSDTKDQNLLDAAILTDLNFATIGGLQLTRYLVMIGCNIIVDFNNEEGAQWLLQPKYNSSSDCGVTCIHHFVPPDLRWSLGTLMPLQMFRRSSMVKRLLFIQMTCILSGCGDDQLDQRPSAKFEMRQFNRQSHVVQGLVEVSTKIKIA